MNQYTKYRIIHFVNRIDDSSLVMGFFKQSGNIMQQAVEEYKQAWKELLDFLDAEVMK